MWFSSVQFMNMDTPIVVDSYSNWKTLMIPTGKRVCHEFEGFFIPFYDYIFERLGVRYPFTIFEKEVLDYLRVPPSQLIPVLEAS